MFFSEKNPLVLFIVMSLTCLAAAQEIPEPAAFFGHEIGAEGEILDYGKSLEYYQLIAERSPRVLLRELGKTTDGNPFILLTISSPENIGRLDKIQAGRHKLTDPRTTGREEALKLSKELPAVVFHTGSIHSSEISTAQVPPLVIYRLATATDDETEFILDNTVILYSPSANPDGQFKYNEWYAEHEGQAWEGRMPWLYHSYLGHDNNRDWILLHFNEQRLTAEHVHNAWNPVYSLEMHEFGSSAARIFVPPYQDPYDYNAPPQVIMTMNALGTSIAHRLISQGKGGVVQNAHFDLFTPARAYQVYRGTARILTETARGNFARSVEMDLEKMDRDIRATGGYNPAEQSWNFPLVWPGGSWTLKDRVDYQVEVNFALLRYAASHREQFSRALYNGFEYILSRSDWPAGYLLPVEQRDPSTTQALLELMQTGDIEIQRLTGDAEINGQHVKAGSYFISLHQPYAAWVKTLFETQEYPDYRDDPEDPPVPPYDITGHTLPLLMNVTALELTSAEGLSLEMVSDAIELHYEIPAETGHGYIYSAGVNHAYILTNRLLERGEMVSRILQGVRVEGVDYPAGSFVVTASRDTIESLTSGLVVPVAALETQPPVKTARLASAPRLAVYEPWGGNMDAGWTRRMLEDYEVSYQRIRNSDFIQGNLNDRFDVIFFPNGLSSDRLLKGTDAFPAEYRGGIGETGLGNLSNFVEAGGYVVAWGSSSKALAELLQIRFKDRREELSRSDYFDPGCIVSIELDVDHPVNYGMEEQAAAVLRYSPLMDYQGDGVSEFGTFASTNTNLSGFLLGEDHIEGRASGAVIRKGNGRVILFTSLPQFRCMTFATYKQLFNAAYWTKTE